MILAIAASFVAGTLATATIITAQGDTIIACVNNNSNGNNVRIVESADDCKNNETPIEWNSQGPAGADGMDGSDGSNCSVSNTENGALITCEDGTSEEIFDGESALTIDNEAPQISLLFADPVESEVGTSITVLVTVLDDILPTQIIQGSLTTSSIPSGSSVSVPDTSCLKVPIGPDFGCELQFMFTTDEIGDYEFIVEASDGLASDFDSVSILANPILDVDGDGFSEAAGDCDDTNDTVFPNALEICDGLDNNCNAEVDEGDVCAFCGNAVIDGNEECDGTDFGVQDCSTNGFNSGTLMCNLSCNIDTSFCSTCGDGIIEGAEQCDDGNDVNDDDCTNSCLLGGAGG